MDSNGSGSGPRIAPNARVGVILVSLYSWTTVTLGVAFTRFVIGIMHKVDFGPDDGMVLGGSIVYTAATVCWQLAVNGGLGKHFGDMSAENKSKYFKSVYAAQFLQLIAMAFAKFSSAFLVGRVAPQSRRKNYFLFGMVGFWTVFSLFAFAFQCGLPKPWILEPPACAHGGPMFTIIALNMLSDIVLAAWIFPIVRPLNMDKDKRITVGVLFGSRAIVPVAAAAQIWAVTRAARGDDPTWNNYELTLLDQAVTSLSLIVASLPRVKRFLGVAGSGLMDARIPDRELARSTRADSTRADSVPLKLIPSNSTKFTTTVMSSGEQDKKKRKKKDKERHPPEWQKFVSMGSKQDEHTSTSSLFEHGGVMMQQEVTVKVEDGDNASTSP